VRRPHAFGGTTQSNSRTDVEQNSVRWRLLRFCEVCRAVNIDPLCPVSLHIVWILSSKCRDKFKLLRKFTEATSHTDSVACLDMEAARTCGLMETNDWLALLQYTSVAAGAPDAAPPGVEVRRLTECWDRSRLGEEYDATPQLLQHILLYVMLEDVPAQKILEMRLAMVRQQQDQPVCRDLEIRCLRCVASFNNVVQDDDAVVYDIMLSLLGLQVLPELRRDIVTALKMQQTRSDAHDTETRRTVGRMQLRRLAEQLHQSKQWVYSATFDAWVAQQQFSVTTTRRQQLLMYFLLAQRKTAAEDKLALLFSPAMLKRMSSQSIDQIDAQAILSVLQSIRLYTHNVSALVDFRTLCLAGVSNTFRKTLSMAQILQLYVCCYQHSSVLEKCWRGTLPVWNYTIRDSCERFAREHEYELDSVLDCIVRCMLDNDRVEEPSSRQTSTEVDDMKPTECDT
jgi:hypothetical protein